MRILPDAGQIRSGWRTDVDECSIAILGKTQRCVSNQMSNDYPDLAPSRRGTILASVICLPLAVAFALLGCCLIALGLASVIGMFWVGHVEVSGIFVLLGFISLIIAVGICAVPIVLVIRRHELGSSNPPPLRKF